jgi:hypothetical protein
MPGRAAPRLSLSERALLTDGDSPTSRDTRYPPDWFARFESSATRVPHAERDDLHAAVRDQQAVTAGLVLPCSSAAAMEGNVNMSR